MTHQKNLLNDYLLGISYFFFIIIFRIVNIQQELYCCAIKNRKQIYKVIWNHENMYMILKMDKYF